MGKGSREAARAQDLEPLSLSELIHHEIRVAIETAVHEELRRSGRPPTNGPQSDVVTATAPRPVR